MTTVIQSGMPGYPATVATRPLQNATGSRYLAFAEIVFGAILILLEVIGLGMGIAVWDIVNMIGGGIWSGIFYIITGALGVIATRAPTTTNADERKGIFTGFLVMSILSSCLAIGMFCFSIPAMIASGFLCSSYYYPGDQYYNTGCANYRRYYDAFIAIRVISMLIHFALFVIFIVTSAFGCCNVCGSGTRVVSTQHVVYTTTAPYPGQPQNVQYYGPPQGGPAPVHFVSAPAQYQQGPMHSGQYEQPPQYAPANVDTQKRVEPGPALGSAM